MLTRRSFLAVATTAGAVGLAGCVGDGGVDEPAAPVVREEIEGETSMDAATVYFTRDISPAGLRAAFDALGVEPSETWP